MQTKGQLMKSLNTAFSFAPPSILSLTIYTKPGENGGLFIREDYNPHINSLTPMELENLREMYEQTEGVHKKVLLQIIRKYGPDKLKL